MFSADFTLFSQTGVLAKLGRSLPWCDVPIASLSRQLVCKCSYGWGEASVGGGRKFIWVKSDLLSCLQSNRRHLFSLTRQAEWWPDRSRLGSLIGTHVWGKFSLPPFSGKKIKHFSVLICLLLVSQQPPHWLFLLVTTWGRQSCFLPHAWRSRLVRAVWSQWESTQKERIRLQRS